MIIPELDNLFIECENWGEDIDDFCIMMEADIGPKDGKGSDIFIIYVTSPKRLLKIMENESIVIGRSLLIMADFNINIVRKTIEDSLNHISGNSWDEVATKICKFFFGNLRIIKNKLFPEQQCCRGGRLCPPRI